MDVIQTESFTFSSLLPPPVRFYDCIEACFECANSSWICADASLNERDRAELLECIEACLTTAEVCAATARVLAREESEQTSSQLQLCIEACQRTSLACRQFADRHEHCLISAHCAEECLRVAKRALAELQK